MLKYQYGDCGAPSIPVAIWEEGHMVTISWNSSLAVGVELIDEQHKMLIDKMNDITKAVEMNRGVPKILKTLDFMIEYTDFHFDTEEKHMLAQEYPGYEAHKAQHEEFKRMVRTLEEDFEEEGVTESLAEAISTFLFNWLVNHIKGIDVQFGKFLDEKDVTLTEP
jgi:hemerythrin